MSLVLGTCGIGVCDRRPLWIFYGFSRLERKSNGNAGDSAAIGDDSRGGGEAIGNGVGDTPPNLARRAWLCRVREASLDFGRRA